MRLAPRGSRTAQESCRVAQGPNVYRRLDLRWARVLNATWAEHEDIMLWTMRLGDKDASGKRLRRYNAEVFDVGFGHLTFDPEGL
ncbi:hypothetical protein NDU88_001706 [Pleurodeles waltl]|uniref:Uncharacterized protein n=1 Tax=Pleurodeles waltl TaxID=8319 RepID=A0AAV7UWU9_PLEWA|nr:hypothetical protein NDU88_001706 [Pleurodeles waltl]